MELEAAERLLLRALRFRKNVIELGGEGASWNARSESGVTHKILLTGIRDPEEIEDQLLSSFVWLWSLKDYIKALTPPDGKSEVWIENEVSLDPNISLAADIANLQKHGVLRRSRSGKFPKLSRLCVNAPQEAIGKITIREREVETDISNPAGVELTLSIFDSQGILIGDGLKLLDYALRFWEGKLGECGASCV